jgi:hypothetical protein
VNDNCYAFQVLTNRGTVYSIRFMLRASAVGCLFFFTGAAVHAQFKEIGPPPVSAAVAREQIRTLLEKIDSTNRKQTVDTISGLLVWYRDLADEEIITAWRGEGRARLPQVLESLADARVASSIVEFSWRQQREATFVPAYVPTLGMLMARYPASAKLFLDDLLDSARNGRRLPDLSPTEAEAVCRILIDMPDLGTWRRDALQILPHYRPAAENLLMQDLHGGEGEKSTAARFWLADLKWGSPDPVSQQFPRRRPAFTSQGAESLPPSIDAPVTATPEHPTPDRPTPDRPTLLRPTSPPDAPAPAPMRAQSGTLQCVGAPIPQNAEYVFHNVPLGKLQLDYDAKTWDVRVAPGEGDTQRLILRNKGTGPQKRCTVHWSIVP